jgi:hypothetical protein
MMRPAATHRAVTLGRQHGVKHSASRAPLVAVHDPNRAKVATDIEEQWRYFHGHILATVYA